MRFEDFKVGMKFLVDTDSNSFMAGEIVEVVRIDSRDNSIRIKNKHGYTQWFLESNFNNLKPIQPCAVQEAIDYIKTYFNSTSEYKAILRKHEKDPNSWDANLRGLNGLPIDQLRELLFGQNVVQDKPFVPDYEQQVILSAADYMSIIDIALMIGDKEWFNELVTKSKYEGAIS